MYNQIKAAAEAAIKLQNKNEMEAALTRIVAMCGDGIIKSQLEDSVTLASAPILLPRECMPAVKRYPDAAYGDGIGAAMQPVMERDNASLREQFDALASDPDAAASPIAAAARSLRIGDALEAKAKKGGAK